MTFEVQQNRWDQTIRRASGSIGPGSRVSETLAELFPVFDVENLPAELLFLSGTKVAFGGANVPSSAGEFSLVQLFNPPDSGHLITITTVWLSSVNFQFYEASLVNTAIGTDAGTRMLRDTRTGVGVGAVGILRTDQNVASSVTTIIVGVSDLDKAILSDPNGIAVLAPGTGMTWGPTIVNAAAIVTFFWRERPALESELNI